MSQEAREKGSRRKSVSKKEDINVRFSHHVLGTRAYHIFISVCVCLSEIESNAQYTHLPGSLVPSTPRRKDSLGRLFISQHLKHQHRTSGELTIGRWKELLDPEVY